MIQQIANVMQVPLAGAALVGALGLMALPTLAQEDRATPCTIDLTRAGQMSDIVSNALMLGLEFPESDVAAFLSNPKAEQSSGDALLKATAAHFGVPESILASEVARYEHCNCEHFGAGVLPRAENDPANAFVGNAAPRAMGPEELAALADATCDHDLASAGAMSDTLSSALMLGLGRPGTDVGTFLKGAEVAYASGDALLKAAAAHFGVREVRLAREVKRYAHCNCAHPGAGVPPLVDDARFRAFARDVTLHVVLHELGHALIREFDLPVLGNEEAAADAFATHYLTTHLPHRALDVLAARTRSLMIEAGELPREAWSVSGEHNSDARRAFQIAALAVAADPAKYTPVATAIGMPADDLRSARDYGTEIHRSWRRILEPLWMPDGIASNEARLVNDSSGEFLGRVWSDAFADELRAAVRRFDWHSQVTIRFVDGDGGAVWSRSERTITVASAYVRRFVTHGSIALD